MESLIARWKATKNSERKSQDARAPSDTAAVHDVSRFNVSTAGGARPSADRNVSKSGSQQSSSSSQTSLSQSPSQRGEGTDVHRGTTTTTTHVAARKRKKSKKQVDRNRQTKGPPPAGGIGKSQSQKRLGAQQGTDSHLLSALHNQSTLSTSVLPHGRTNRRNFNFLVDETVYKVVDVFKISDSTNSTYQERVARVRLLIESFADTLRQSSIIQELSPGGGALLPATSGITTLEDKKAVRHDAQAKVIKSLEERLMESERHKLSFKNELSFLQSKIQLLERENDALRVSQTLLKEARQGFSLVERTNQDLRQELAEAKRRNAEQQHLFNAQVEEITLLMDQLKQQLARNNSAQDDYENDKSLALTQQHQNEDQK